MQAALHHRLRLVRAAHGHAQFGGLALGVGLKNRIGADVHANLCGQRLHLGLVADQRGQDEPFNGSLDSALKRHAAERPDHRRGNGRQFLAALQKFVKDVVIGRMADQRVNGNGLGQGC